MQCYYLYRMHLICKSMFIDIICIVYSTKGSRLALRLLRTVMRITISCASQVTSLPTASSSLFLPRQTSIQVSLNGTLLLQLDIYPYCCD